MMCVFVIVFVLPPVPCVRAVCSSRVIPSFKGCSTTLKSPLRIGGAGVVVLRLAIRPEPEALSGIAVPTRHIWITITLTSVALFIHLRQIALMGYRNGQGDHQSRHYRYNQIPHLRHLLIGYHLHAIRPLAPHQSPYHAIRHLRLATAATSAKDTRRRGLSHLI